MDAIWIALLSSSAWGIINALVAGWLVRSRTRSESDKMQAEGKKFQSEAEERIYRKLQDQLNDALNRADTAEQRANEAIEEAHLQGSRVMLLIRMFEAHIPWDRSMVDLAMRLGAEATDIPAVPELNPYTVFTLVENGKVKRRRRRKITNSGHDDDDEEDSA